MILVTEGERIVFCYGILSTDDEGVSDPGLGYDILRENNNQKVQEEGIRWSNNFVSFIIEDNLEAGARADLFEKKLKEGIQTVLSQIINPQSRDEELAVGRCKDVLWRMKRYKCYRERFVKIRYLIWLKFVVFCMMVMTKLKVISEVKMKSYDPGGKADETKCYRDCSEENKLKEGVKIEKVKELQIWYSRLINGKNSIIANQLGELSTNIPI
jgi:hypothetical protein